MAFIGIIIKKNFTIITILKVLLMFYWLQILNDCKYVMHIWCMAQLHSAYATAPQCWQYWECIHFFRKYRISERLLWEPCLIVLLCSFWALTLVFSQILTLFKSFAIKDLKWLESVFTLFSLCVLKFYSLQHKGAEFPEAVHPLCAVLSGSVRYVQYLKQHFTAYFDHFTHPKG